MVLLLVLRTFDMGSPKVPSDRANHATEWSKTASSTFYCKVTMAGYSVNSNLAEVEGDLRILGGNKNLNHAYEYAYAGFRSRKYLISL